jgi:hypothetical protein
VFPPFPFLRNATQIVQMPEWHLPSPRCWTVCRVGDRFGVLQHLCREPPHGGARTKARASRAAQLILSAADFTRANRARREMKRLREELRDQRPVAVHVDEERVVALQRVQRDEFDLASRARESLGELALLMDRE